MHILIFHINLFVLSNEIVYKLLIFLNKALWIYMIYN